MSISFEDVWNYCTSNNRAIPRDWNKFWNMLANKKQKPGGGWQPSIPLILAAWWETTPLDKQLRFKEHVEWAFSNKQEEEIYNYLKSLKEEEWFHFGEL